MKRRTSAALKHFAGKTLLCLLMGATALIPLNAGAMTFQAGDYGKMEITGAFKASFGMTRYLDWVDDNDKGDDSDFDATRELSLKAQWILSDNLKGVVSFQIGEGSTGGYFGATDAVVGGEEDGDLIIELDRLYIDFTTDNGINFKIGSQLGYLPDITNGSHIMSEIPAGVTAAIPLSKNSALELAWFRIADLMDDSENNTDDQADLFWARVPMDMGNISLAPWAAYANIQEDVVRNAPSYWRYAYFDYPAFLTGANSGITDYMPTEDVTSYYVGTTLGFSPNDALTINASITYGEMDWETAAVDATIAGYFADLAITYKMDNFTPEFFTFYGNGPDADDDDLDMMPVLIGGPTYTSSYFGGSRFNDNMFDSYDSCYATSMWAVGFKLKDIKTGEKLKHEFQLMYAEGTAEDTLFEAPDDILLNEDESIVEVNFNSEYQIMDHLIFATELGYITFDEDKDYDEHTNGSVEDFWKIACAVELSF